MNIKSRVKVIALLLMLGCSLTTWGKIINKDSGVYSTYTLEFDAPKAMLSRDGGEAIEVKAGKVISQPGTYFLSYYVEGKLVVQSFQIKSQPKEQYIVSIESDLREIFKTIIENYQSEVILKFNYDIETKELPIVIANTIRSLLRNYPMLVCNVDQCFVYTDTPDTSIIKMKMSYPLQMTQNLLKYDELAKTRMYELIEKNVEAEMKDYEVEGGIIEALLEMTTYSLHDGQTINATSMSHTLQGAFLDGNIVCDGYSKSLMCLLNMVGIPTRYVEGTARQQNITLNHAWNLVKLQGAYYHVDPTWADQYHETTGYYRFINETDQMMRYSHNWMYSAYPKTMATYSLPYTAIMSNMMYEVEDKADFMMALDKIKRENRSKGCMALGRETINRWPQKLVRTLFYIRLGLQYQCKIENKYDCMLIYFSYF